MVVCYGSPRSIIRGTTKLVLRAFISEEVAFQLRPEWGGHRNIWSRTIRQRKQREQRSCGRHQSRRLNTQTYSEPREIGTRRSGYAGGDQAIEGFLGHKKESGFYSKCPTDL